MKEQRKNPAGAAADQYFMARAPAPAARTAAANQPFGFGRQVLHLLQSCGERCIRAGSPLRQCRADARQNGANGRPYSAEQIAHAGSGVFCPICNPIDPVLIVVEKVLVLVGAGIVDI